MKVLLTSKFSDSNIFHFFALEINALWQKISANPETAYSIYLEDDQDSPPYRWRRDLIRSLVPVYTDLAEIPGDFDRCELLDCQQWMVEPWEFRNYQPSAVHLKLAEVVKRNLGIPPRTGSKVVLINREHSRRIHDDASGKRMESVLAEFCLENGVPYAVATFDDCSLGAQAELLSDARVMIANHGAANTNLFLLPENGHLIEINFRRFWHCDPVCDAHFSNTIRYRDRCRGKLTFRPDFHKADYHNLAQLFARKYTEIQLVDADTFLDRNPINLKNVFVHSEDIFTVIRREFLR